VALIDEIPEPWNGQIRRRTQANAPGADELMAKAVLAALDNARASFDQIVYDEATGVVAFAHGGAQPVSVGPLGPIYALLELLGEEKRRLARLAGDARPAEERSRKRLDETE
jgi:hypothetical protein